MGTTSKRTTIQKKTSIFYRYNKYTNTKDLAKKLIFLKGIKPELKHWTTEFVIEFFDTFNEAGVTSPVHG